MVNKTPKVPVDDFAWTNPGHGSLVSGQHIQKVLCSYILYNNEC